MKAAGFGSPPRPQCSAPGERGPSSAGRAACASQISDGVGEDGPKPARKTFPGRHPAATLPPARISEALFSLEPHVWFPNTSTFTVQYCHDAKSMKFVHEVKVMPMSVLQLASPALLGCRPARLLLLQHHCQVGPPGEGEPVLGPDVVDPSYTGLGVGAGGAKGYGMVTAGGAEDLRLCRAGAGHARASERRLSWWLAAN